MLVGDVLPAGVTVGEDAAEAVLRIKPRRARRLEQARRNRAAALGRGRHLEFVFQPLVLRRHLVALGISSEIASVADGGQQLHLVDRLIGIAGRVRRVRILDRAPATEPHARPGVGAKIVEHGLQRADRRIGDAAAEYLAERNAIERRCVDRLAGAFKLAGSSMGCMRIGETNTY